MSIYFVRFPYGSTKVTIAVREHTAERAGRAAVHDFARSPELMAELATALGNERIEVTPMNWTENILYEVDCSEFFHISALA